MAEKQVDSIVSPVLGREEMSQITTQDPQPSLSSCHLDSLSLKLFCFDFGDGVPIG